MSLNPAVASQSSIWLAVAAPASDEIAHRVDAAREQTWNMLTAVGGAASVCARSCGTSWVRSKTSGEWCATYRAAIHGETAAAVQGANVLSQTVLIVTRVGGGAAALR